MLQSLSIRDFVLIESLDLEFDTGFAALTGETGAGKSIVLDALGLTLGARAETGLVRQGAARAEVTAAFSVEAKSAIGHHLKQSDIAHDFDEPLVLRRVVDASGKSRAFINGRPAPVAELRAVGALLVDVHAQHEHQALLQTNTQRDWLDEFSGALAERLAVSNAHRAHSEARAALARAQTEQSAIERERAELAERLERLAELAPRAGEWEELVAEQARQSHGQQLVEAVSQSVETLAEGDDAALTQLDACLTKLETASALDPKLGEALTTLKSARVEIDEASSMLRDYLDRFETDPSRGREVEARLSAWFQFSRRFKVVPAELVTQHEAWRARDESLAKSLDLASLQAEVDRAHGALSSAASALTAKRIEGGKRLTKKVNAMLGELSLGSSQFGVSFSPLDAPTAHGGEEPVFQMTSHPSLPMAPIAKAASGGELARLTLAIVVALGEAGGVPTLVFDEIDVGIGGAVAATVGGHLHALSKRRQVLCVTHQAQVAGQADGHLRLQKHETKKSVTTQARWLDANERVEELARMLSGHTVTEATRAHARELLRPVK